MSHNAVCNAITAPCLTPDQLHDWVRIHANIIIPRAPVCPNHHAPFDYLCRAYFEPATDLVVWAPRGGGKTRLGAVATLLDLLHKPPCQVRILGGSLEQSMKMWEHLSPSILQTAQRLILGRPRSRHIELKTGSAVAVLTQSQRAVRGLRVQKLRCDEVELFDPDIWAAAQLVTRSRSALPPVTGTVEAISTLHTPFGLMHRIIDDARNVGRPVIRWCLLEVLEHCPQDRPCDACPLHDDCLGLAKTRCTGFVKIDDAIAAKRRVSRETWEAEMLCRRPATRHAVFPSFNEDTHLRQQLDPPLLTRQATLSLSMDFGFANPFVCLWIITSDDGRTHVIDEYVQPARQMSEHLDHIAQRPWGRARKITCDPAGNSRNDQTAASNVTLLRHAGYHVRSRHSRIVDGLEMIRAALSPAAGPTTLFIHPRCARLIRAMHGYRYAELGSELPVKDGTHDHLIDALRYHYVNRLGTLSGRRY